MQADDRFNACKTHALQLFACKLPKKKGNTLLAGHTMWNTATKNNYLQAGVLPGDEL
jgi:hypothetical protein